jgi:hypothetical protein
MPKLPRVGSRECLAALHRLGFVVVRQEVATSYSGGVPPAASYPTTRKSVPARSRESSNRREFQLGSLSTNFRRPRRARLAAGPW